ncbi:hypothetical protein [Arthrobacter sp. SLBN-122]|uniref:hypothetical protein n=1 Tax=Arthrobacter sp. SLBN-122 TaxID=2768455 RepID=UPI001150B1FA|nr:hypothetical protein [Arthrobacter sp. SLBN-122]
MAGTNRTRKENEDENRINLLARGAVTQELDALLPAFQQWYREHEGTCDFKLVLEQLTGFYNAYGASRLRPPTVTAMDPEWLLEMMAALFAVHQKCAVLIATNVYDFFRFLRDTKRWSGSSASYAEAQAILRAAIFEDMITGFPQALGGPRVATLPCHA